MLQDPFIGTQLNSDEIATNIVATLLTKEDLEVTKRKQKHRKTKDRELSSVEQEL